MPERPTSVWGIEKEVVLSSVSSFSSSNFYSDVTRTSGGFEGQYGQSSNSLDEGTVYIIGGVLGILLIIVIIKFNYIKTLPKKLKSRKGRKNEIK